MISGQARNPTAPSVLVVDDDINILTLLERWLSGAGCHVWCATNAEEGLRTCAEQNCQIVFCDITMPGRGGVWLAQQLLATNSGTVLIFSTAVDNLPPRLTLQSGVAAYMVKPLTRAKVLSALSQALGVCGTLAKAPDAT